MAKPDLEALREETVELVLYDTSEPEDESWGCVNVWPFWDQDIPQQGDKLVLDEGEWTISCRRFEISPDDERQVVLYADPPAEEAEEADAGGLVGLFRRLP